MIDTNRRGFLRGLGAALVAAPAILKAPLEMTPRGIIMPMQPLIFMEGDLAYSGVIIRLVEYRKEVSREFIRENLFGLYRRSSLLSDLVDPGG